VEFIRDGGLDQARAREKADLEEDRRLAAVKDVTPVQGDGTPRDFDDPIWHGAVSAIAQSVCDLLIRR
jgi:hypothetical protein